MSTCSLKLALSFSSVFGFEFVQMDLSFIFLLEDKHGWMLCESQVDLKRVNIYLCITLYLR